MARRSKKESPSFRDRVLAVLGEVDRPGDVCASGDRPLTMPGVDVDGLGTLRLPLGGTQARKLIKLCRQAPYGKGTRTVVDTDVRRVWELDPKDFRLTNPKWDELIASILAEVQKELGLARHKLKAQLYKLLVYEKGSFFLPHRDGEKLDRMVATLVVGLPAIHKGGELIVSHGSRQHEIVFGGAASGHELSYAAFYADCTHEVRPVRSGYRLCLTYNVTLATSRGKKGIAAPSYGDTIATLAEVLGGWQDDPVPKIAVTLDHRYTEDGLGIDMLKGSDRAKAEVLFQAAEQADCVAHLALITLWQAGSAEGGDDEYAYRSRGRHHWGGDEDVDETTSDYEMGEIYDQSLTVNHWLDGKGQEVRLGEMDLSENEIFANEALDDSEPSREDFEGYTGNAGMTLERWYHRAAIVIWPRAWQYEVLCEAGTDAAIGGLEVMVKGLKGATKAKREAQRGECLSFATAIIDSWKPEQVRGSWGRTPTADRSAFLVSLCELGDADLLRRFLVEVMPIDTTVQVDKSFAQVCRQRGWSSFEEELTAVVEVATADSVIRNAELLRILCTQRDKNVERIGLCARLCERAVRALESFDGRVEQRDWRATDVNRANLLTSLVTAMLAIGAEEPLSLLLDHTLSSKKYDLTNAHLAAILGLKSRVAKSPAGSAGVLRWLSSCRRALESRTAEAPQKPGDHRRAHNLSCSCNDCRALSAFLADPNQHQARFPLAKQRRQHLHGVIGKDRCDCTHVTERRGRPYTLVCTKTTASYETARAIYERDLRNLAEVVALIQRYPL